MMKVSIIIPMYNAESTISGTLKALLRQSIAIDEIIVIDDGSTDGSLIAVQKLHNEIIKIIYQENAGTASAKNAGIREAHSEFIMFVDSDDTVEDDYVETHLSWIEKCDMVCSGMKVIYPLRQSEILINSHMDKVNKIVDTVDLLHLLEDGELFNVDVAKIYRKSILSANNIFFDETMSTGEDLMFNCEYFKHINNGILIDYCGYNYIRLEKGSLVSKYKTDLSIIIDKMVQSREDLYKNLQVENRDFFRQRFNDTSLSAYISKIPNMYRKECLLTRKEKEEYLSKIRDETRRFVLINYANKKELIMHFIVKYNPMFSNFVFSVLFLLKDKFGFVYRKVFK